MTVSFEAACVRWQQEDGVAMVGFADDEFSPNRYLLLQRALEPDSDDVESGFDKVRLELNEQNRSTYGGIEGIQLEKDRVVVRLDDRAARVVTSGDPTIEIRFHMTGERERELANGLRAVAGDLLGAEKVPDRKGAEKVSGTENSSKGSIPRA